MTETWLKNLKSGCGAAQRPHESKMIAVSSPDHRFLTFGELAIYVRFTPKSGHYLGSREESAFDPNVWTGCCLQERICWIPEVADMYPACLVGTRAVALMGVRTHVWSH